MKLLVKIGELQKFFGQYRGSAKQNDRKILFARPYRLLCSVNMDIGRKTRSIYWTICSFPKRLAPLKLMIGDEGIVSALSNKSRCRLITSWGWRRSQGSGCSPVKVVRELGSERRKTVRSLSCTIVDIWGDSSLVREDWDEGIPGVPVVSVKSIAG